VISDHQSKGSGERRHGVAALSFSLEDLSIVGEFFFSKSGTTERVRSAARSVVVRNL